MDLVCAFRGCSETCPHGELPAEWICLVTFRETATPGVLNFLTDRTERDAVLCPIHAGMLEGLLKRIR